MVYYTKNLTGGGQVNVFIPRLIEADFVTNSPCVFWDWLGTAQSSIQPSQVVNVNTTMDVLPVLW